MYYRIRTRLKAIGGNIVTIADNVPNLKRAYEIIMEHGKGTPRKYYIDEIEPKLFSKLSVREAQIRLEEIQTEERKEE